MLKIYHNTPSVTPHAKSQVDYDLRKFVEKLSFPRVFDTNENSLARDLVFKEFVEIFGENPTVVGATKNVVMGNPQTASIIVGAHYDSVPGTPGADDNASAVATMFRIAANTKHKNNVCFVAFNGEECGLLGAKEFVAQNEMKNVQQVHILEMVGYRTHEPNSQKNPLSHTTGLPTVGNFIGALCNDSNFMSYVMNCANSIDIPVVGIVAQIDAEETYKIVKKVAPHLFRSDHAPFWKHLYPAIMWTDTSEFRNPHYHKSTDTPETLDYEFMAAFSDLIVESIESEQE